MVLFVVPSMIALIFRFGFGYVRSTDDIVFQMGLGIISKSYSESDQFLKRIMKYKTQSTDLKQS